MALEICEFCGKPKRTAVLSGQKNNLCPALCGNYIGPPESHVDDNHIEHHFYQVGKNRIIYERIISEETTMYVQIRIIRSFAINDNNILQLDSENTLIKIVE